MIMKTTPMRPHRFPPLGQVTVGHEPGSAAQLQAALAEGFQEGLNKGYQEGFESGVAGGAEEARAEGRAQGREEGLTEMRQRFAALAKPVEALRSEFLQLQSEYQAALRREVVDLVEKVARQVIRAELTLKPAQLLALVNETLAQMPVRRDGVQVFLNTDDLRRVQELAPEQGRAWNLMPDAALAAGEIRLIAGGREADAGAEQRLAACMSQVATQVLEEEVEASATEERAE